MTLFTDTCKSIAPKEFNLMYHPYMHEEAKQIMKERRSRADTARLIRQLRQARLERSERTNLISRVGFRLSALLSGLKDWADTHQQNAQNVPLDIQPMPSLAED
jgi:hypothetical protein